MNLLEAAMERRAEEQRASFNPKARKWARDSWAIAGPTPTTSWKPKPAPCSVHRCKDDRGFYIEDIAMHLCKFHLSRYRRGLPLQMDDLSLYGATQSRDMQRMARR